MRSLLECRPETRWLVNNDACHKEGGRRDCDDQLLTNYASTVDRADIVPTVADDMHTALHRHSMTLILPLGREEDILAVTQFDAKLAF